MDTEELDSQARLFSVLSSELRLRLLTKLADDPVTAPELAEDPAFQVTAETIHNNLKQLRDVGLVESERVYGPGNRPKDAFSLHKDGFEIILSVSDDYTFDLEYFD